MLIPIMETWVFAGRKLDPEDVEDRLYFQDVQSYLHGVRYNQTPPTTRNFKFQQERTSTTFLNTKVHSRS
jgi:hypothetical protein